MNGDATGAVELTTTATDLVTGIPSGTGHAGLRYTADAASGHGIATETHQVVYTLLEG